MACLGPGEVDLGWFLFMDRYVAANAGVDTLPGFLDREQVRVCPERELGIAMPQLIRDPSKVSASIQTIAGICVTRTMKL